MAFTVRDFHDLVEILQQQPDWRAELRRLVLSEELLTLPQLVRELAESQRQVGQRLDRLGQIVADLAAAQRQTEQRVAELHEAQIRTEQRLGRIEVDHGSFKGFLLEERHRQRPFIYLQSLIRRARVIEGSQLDELLDDAMSRGALSQKQADDIVRADVVVRGRLKTDGSEVYLVVEVSWGVGASDVDRAARRAKLLALAGIATMPVVSGNGITPEAVDRCRELQVWQLIAGGLVEPGS
jgi:hypothetical protein